MARRTRSTATPSAISWPRTCTRISRRSPRWPSGSSSNAAASRRRTDLETAMKHGLVIALIVMALAGRMLPHPDNFTPVLAVALFGGATLTGGLAFLVPLAAMFASDVALGHELSWMTLVVYGCFLAGVGLGRWLGKRR